MMRQVLASVFLLAAAGPAYATVFFGAETEAIVGRSSSVTGDVSVNKVFYGPDGGDGFLSATTTDSSARGDADSYGDFSNVSAGVPVPFLTVKATGGNDGLFSGVAEAFAGAVGSYRYTGPSGNVTFQWRFVGALAEPDISATYPNNTTTAFFNVRGGLVTDLLQFETDIQQVNALNVADTFIEAFNTNLESESFDENGAISIPLNSGDIFSLTLRLSSWAGNPDATADAEAPLSAGLSGEFVLPSGGSLSLVPEPSLPTFLGCSALATAVRYRKRRSSCESTLGRHRRC